MTRGPDERADFALMRELIFQDQSVSLDHFTGAEQRSGKAADFRVVQNGNLVALCEVKSPRDDWLDEQLDESSGGIFGGPRLDGTFNRLGRQVKNAAKQFAAVDEARAVPHILVIINHDEMARYTDLVVTFDGFERADDGSQFPVQPGAAEGVKWAAVPQVDLIVWIDARSRAVRFMKNETRLNAVSRAFDLLGVPRPSRSP